MVWCDVLSRDVSSGLALISAETTR